MQPQLEPDASPTPARRGGAPATGLPPDLTAYVLSPKDVVAARSRDWDDRLSWLLQRQRYGHVAALVRFLAVYVAAVLQIELPCRLRGGTCLARRGLSLYKGFHASSRLARLIFANPPKK